MRLAALLAIVIIVIIARYPIAFRAGDMAVMTIRITSAIATGTVCFLVVSATGIVARLRLVLEF